MSCESELQMAGGAGVESSELLAVHFDFS